MPSMAVHFAVGREFLKYNKIKDKESFRKGILEPDLLGLLSQKDKEKAHFSEKKDDLMSLRQKLETKVNLLMYLNMREINSDFERGYYLHLLTDYYFFNDFLFKTKTQFNETIIDMKMLYDDYEKIAKDMEENFGVDNRNTPWDGLYQEGEPVFFTKKEIFEFIKKCSKLDIMKIRKEILKDPQNWRSVADSFFK